MRQYTTCRLVKLKLGFLIKAQSINYLQKLTPAEQTYSAENSTCATSSENSDRLYPRNYICRHKRIRKTFISKLYMCTIPRDGFDKVPHVL